MIKRKKAIYQCYFKRLFDLVVSFIIIIFLSPVFGVVSLFLWIKLGNPILFKQKRPGLNEEIFKIYKFRTLTNKKDNSGELLPDIDRLTKFGIFLRSTSLDELPELFNIIKGDMSFIGPRPLLVQYLPLYNKEQKKRHNVRPGLSGLAQVSGRNAITWEEKFKLDIVYINNITIIGDIRIIIATLKKVLSRKGISSENSVTMEPFSGNKRGYNE